MIYPGDDHDDCFLSVSGRVISDIPDPGIHTTGIALLINVYLAEVNIGVVS